MTNMSDQLFAYIARHAPDVPPEILEAVVQLIDKHDINDFISFQAEVGNLLDSSLMANICAIWRSAPNIQGRDIATAFRTAALIGNLSTGEFAQLVATVPWDDKSACRDSMSAYLNVINQAQRHITIAMYVVYEVDEILKALQHAQNRGVQIRLLLEQPSTLGGKISGDHNSADIVRKHLSSTEIYVPNAQKLTGSMHAKFVSADSSRAFVTSANLTRAALSTNIEVGVLVSRGLIPKQIDAMFDQLIVRNAIIRI